MFMTRTLCGLNPMKSFLCCLLVAVLVAVVLAGCTESSSSSDSSAVSAVKRSMTAVSSSGRSYRTGSLEGGTAVLVGDAAYWVRSGVVYAANGIAKTWSPGISYASSPSISYDSVRQAAR